MTRWSALMLGCMVAVGCQGQHEGPGTPEGKRVPEEVLKERGDAQRQAFTRFVGTEGTGTAAKQVLFGDLHVHSTFSLDAFMMSLPMMSGEGAHPPADACDFARYCSELDFWSINDHAEAVTPQHWRETKEAIRQCNANAGDPKNPDVVAFLGWEWTQVGATPEKHYGHKNVILRETAEDRVPARPISAPPQLMAAFQQGQRPLWQRIMIPLLDFPERQRYYDFAEYQEELQGVSRCPDGVDTRKLPADCQEVAETPEVLFEKLAQWGFDSLVIPHGTTWGLYTPLGASWDKQLTARNDDPTRNRLIEVHSGHGNSEEYRDWRAIEYDAAGKPSCPAPTKGYTPCCWQAGEIIRSRCGNASPEECERRVVAARANFLAAGQSGHLAVPGTTIEEWGDCGQCRDCFLPAFNYRPASSVQYTLALTNFDDPKAPRRFRWGFIASSDNHKARPGTGYKEYDRRLMTEATGAASARARRWADMPDEAPQPESRAFDPQTSGFPLLALFEGERQASFFLTGGLVAVHSEGRDRDAIWGALQRREVYGTSGDRQLLWFDLVNDPAGVRPMGSETRLAADPKFRVRAVGGFKQKPGCPEHALKGLTADRLGRLCRNECYNPSDERHLITRIEVIRIRPQQRAGEPVGPLIEDPWRTFKCPPDPGGCAVEFTDTDFVSDGRDSVYYVRAVQEPTPAVNADNLRCQKRDPSGACLEVKPCYGDWRTPFDDDCLAPAEERAWSSPIYVNLGG